jgi:serine protease
MNRSYGLLSGLLVIALYGCDSSPSNVRTEPTAPVLVRFPASAGQVPALVAGEVVVRVRDGVDIAAVAREHGLAVARRGYENRFNVLRGAAGAERALAARLNSDTRVVWAEPNWLRQPAEVDPRLWAFHNPGDLWVTYTSGRNRGTAVTGYLSVEDADEDNIDDRYGARGRRVVLGSIDTGVDFGHEQFMPGQLIAGWDWYSDDDDPSDEDGHGTHTTGTMIGRTVGVAGVSGAGANVQVYVQRVCGPPGCPVDAIASAIAAAADYQGLVAMNLSLGGTNLSQAEADAIDYATARGVLVIASAGNGGTGTIECPACDPDAISVAATNWQDELAYYSNWGPGLDIAAPGGELYRNTTDEAGIYSSVPGGYAYYQGTSMAAPQVTGTAGVVASVRRVGGVELRWWLESTTDDLGATGYDEVFGHGRLNSYRAVTGATPD